MPPKTDTHAAHIATGIYGEEEALRYLSRKGFRLTARNWRPRGGIRNRELDLVGEWGKKLVFVEVKTRHARTSETTDGPAGLHGFTPAKQRTFVLAARAYLAEKGLWDKPCRFDLVCITLLPGTPPQVDHYRDVIEFGQTVARKTLAGKIVDSGDASWQPW